MTLAEELVRILNHLEWRYKAMATVQNPSYRDHNSKQVMILQRRRCEILRAGDEEVEELVKLGGQYRDF